MSDGSETDTIATHDEFETALETLLTEAERNGVDPRGSWVCENDNAALSNWEVEIYELE